MKAILIKSDKALSYEFVPDPEVKPDDILIKVKAAGVNRADLLQREGKYPSPAGCPEWMGLEVAGTVEKMGETAKMQSSLKIGDSVCALLGGGGYAEYVSTRYDMVLPLPEGFDFEHGACIPEVYSTAYLNLFHEAGLKSGETLVVFAGGSGVGIAATQIAKAFGAKVISTVRSDAKAKTISKYGADLIINTEKTSLDEVFSSNNVNVVLDCVGGSQLGNYFTRMARYGRWIMIATLGGTVSQIDLAALLSGGFCLKGSTLRSRTPQFKAALLKELQRDLYPYFECGKIKPDIYASFPIHEAAEAHEILYKNKNIGKVVLTF